jgi:hypothetical protein
MDTSIENQPPEPDVILNLIKNAIGRCRESSSQLCGFVRGLEIGISTLQGTESIGQESVEHLQGRSLRLSASRNDYHRGVALGIDLAISVASATFSRVSPVV